MGTLSKVNRGRLLQSKNADLKNSWSELKGSIEYLQQQNPDPAVMDVITRLVNIVEAQQEIIEPSYAYAKKEAADSSRADTAR